MIKNSKFTIKDSSGLKHTYFPNFNFLLPQEELGNNSVFYSKLKKYFELFEQSPKSSDSVEDTIRKEIANVRKFLFEVSESCNLRCRYCVYSGKFSDRRQHSNKMMDWETARSAVDYISHYFKENEEIRRTPYFLTIAFYGGEPLLNFKLIEKVIEYSRESFQKIFMGKYQYSLVFDLTTNGLLLDESKIDFLVKNNCGIMFSLDGPESIQDLNRGKGNFQKLMRNINYIKNKYPDYLRERVVFSTVYAKDTDLELVRDFFSDEIFEECRSLKFGYVVERFSDLRFPELGINEKAVVEKIKDKKRRGEKLFRIEDEILKVYFGMDLGTLIMKRHGSFGGYCILGSKMMFFKSNGDISGCEKMSESFKIGDIYKGINYSRIKEIHKEWLEKTKRCGNCAYKAICLACMAQIGVNGELMFDGYCESLKENFHKRAGEYIEFQKI
jgi:uncharacterized protein